MEEPLITVLGSCTLDLVFRMSRQPQLGETLFADSLELHAGGKGLNQAIAARRLGARAALIARVGTDPFAEPLIAALETDGVDLQHLARDPEAGSGVAAPIVLADGQNSIFSAPRANLAIPVAQVEAAAATIRASRMLLLQFEAPMDANFAAARIAEEAGVPLLLNPAPALPHPPELLARASLLVLNEVEAEMLAPGFDSHESRARALQVRGPKAVIITLGPEGALLLENGVLHQVPSFPVTAVDSVGAGDAFCGALAVALAEEMPLREAVRFACAAGALAVTRPGAAPSLPQRAEVDSLRKAG